jgi:hypothetical protein
MPGFLKKKYLSRLEKGLQSIGNLKGQAQINGIIFKMHGLWERKRGKNNWRSTLW